MCQHTIEYNIRFPARRPKDAHTAPRLGTGSGPRYFHGDFSHALFTTGTHLGNATGGAAVKTIGATPRTVSTRRRWRAPAAGSRVPFNINCVWNIIALEKRVPRDGPGRPVIPDACDRVRPCLCITRGGGWGGAADKRRRGSRTTELFSAPYPPRTFFPRFEDRLGHEKCVIYSSS